MRATGRWDFQPSNDFGIAARRAVERLRISKFAPVLAAVSLMASASVVAQTPGIPRQATAHVVVNFAELARQEAAYPPAANIPGPRVPRVAPFLTVPGDRPVPPEFVRQQKPAAPEAALGLPSAAVASPSPLESFEALRDQDVFIPPSSFANFIPPDTMGAAGPNHLMVTLNSQVRIQNRSGVEQSIISLENFWTSTGATGVFDPKIIYDPYSSRWIFTAMSNSGTASSSVLIGGSQTNDPTGAWNLFKFDADAGNTLWADYPSLGFNKDWVVVSVNMFGNVSGAFGGARLFLFRKSLLYNNTLSTATLFNETAGGARWLPRQLTTIHSPRSTWPMEAGRTAPTNTCGSQPLREQWVQKCLPSAIPRTPHPVLRGQALSILAATGLSVRREAWILHRSPARPRRFRMETRAS
ncbi:MAG: hypothetical protein HY651_07320 [Acidobacteria bacterium]|nr:hypothetical protein [Acidobacteriota bacterium]